ncbi:hypothetical protein AC1031_016530 [Aphanomyces cochlioides]|nr:hypothetical protein AC1031_016530 [Aphanomyces cochlioides]
MKKPKASTPVRSLLPLDVFIKIAFYLPGAADLFAFLEALRPYNLLGPLEHLSLNFGFCRRPNKCRCLSSRPTLQSLQRPCFHVFHVTHLYKLGSRRDHWIYLWPRLVIPRSFNSWSTSYEAIAKYYSTVAIQDLGQAAWLKKHLDPQTKIEWVVEKFPNSVSEIADEVWDLRIARVRFGFKHNSVSSGKEILSRLKHLTSLKVHVKHAFSTPEILNENHRIWDDIFKFVAQSDQLTEFEFFRETHAMTASSLVQLIEWFRRQPVRVFECKAGTWDQINKSLNQSFYEAIFNCPTLDKLVLSNCDFHGLDFSRLKFSKRSLQLGYCSIGSEFIISLASRLEISKITQFKLCVCRDISIDSIVYLYLTLTDISFNIENLIKLAQLVENCALETLSLHTILSSRSFVESLVTAIQSNQTIHDLELSLPGITVEEMRLLIQSVCHPRRRVKRKRLRLRIPKDDEEEHLVKSLKDFAVEYGGEFADDSH